MKRIRGIRDDSSDDSDDNNFNLLHSDIKPPIKGSSITTATSNESGIDQIDNILSQFSFAKNESTLIYQKNQSQIEEEKNYLQVKPRPYQVEMYEQARGKNSIIYMETGKGKTLISIMIINDLFNQYRRKIKNGENVPRPKVIFLVCDIALLEQQVKTIKLNTGLNVTIIKGKAAKKSKNDYNEFRSMLAVSDVFVAIPDVVYKLLSVGFLRIFDINLLIFDECHHCDSNHSYNLIMNEFYYFYLSKDKNAKLPLILGLTASPLKSKITNNIEETALKAMTTLCENLNSQIVIDPELKFDNKSMSSIIIDNKEEMNEREYIETKSHLTHPHYPILYKILEAIFFNPILDYLFTKKEIFISKGSDSVISDKVLNETKQRYSIFIKEKFNVNDFGEYNKILAKNSTLYNLSRFSVLFRIFEKIQRNLFMIIESMNLETIFQFFSYYKGIYTKKMEEKRNMSLDNLESVMIDIDQLTPEEIRKMNIIFTNCVTGLKKAIEKGFDFESDRLNQLKQRLKSLYETTKNNRIIIFVANRIVARFLRDIINSFLKEISPDLSCASVVGVNKKKTENNSVFDPKNTVLQLNAEINKFNLGEANVLIGTSTVEEGLDIQSCNIVMVFTELNTAKSYIQMKGRARRTDAQFLAFTNSKEKTVETINEFIRLGECMKNLFDNGNVKDFKRKNYLNIKYIGESSFFYIKKTEAKLSLRNVVPIYNETIQQLGNKRIIIQNKKNWTERNVKPKKLFNVDFTFFSSIFPNGSIQFSSGYQSDKQTAENICYFQLEKFLYNKNIIDDHFKVSNNEIISKFQSQI